MSSPISTSFPVFFKKTRPPYFIVAITTIREAVLFTLDTLICGNGMRMLHRKSTMIFRPGDNFPFARHSTLIQIKPYNNFKNVAELILLITRRMRGR
jgi:hypothetical protein